MGILKAARGSRAKAAKGGTPPQPAGPMQVKTKENHPLALLLEAFFKTHGGKAK